MVIVTSGREGWVFERREWTHKEDDWGNGAIHSKGDLLRFDVHILGVDMRALHCSLMLTDSFMCY